MLKFLFFITLVTFVMFLISVNEVRVRRGLPWLECVKIVFWATVGLGTNWRIQRKYDDE